MIDVRTGEVWFYGYPRKEYRNFHTKSDPLGPVLRIHSNSLWGRSCTYRTYAAYIKIVNRGRRPSLRMNGRV